MKILIGVHHFPPKYRGGAEWRAHRTAAALLRAGHQASVICVEQVDDAHANPINFRDDVFEGVPVRRLSFDLSASPDPLRWEYDNQWIGAHLSQVFSKQKPDIFHLISGYLLTSSSLAAAQDAGVTTVVTLTDFWFLCRRFSMLRSDGTLSALPIDPLRCARCLGEERRRYRWLGRIAPSLMNQFWKYQGSYYRYFSQRWTHLQAVLAKTDLAICPSQFLQTMYTEAGMQARRMEFLRQGHTFGRMRAVDLAKSPSTSLRIGYLGQLAPLKGVHVLVDAVRLLASEPIELYIYGDDTANPQYSEMLRQKAHGDARIHFMGVYERPQLTTVLRALDIIVVPSLWYENSPNVILEALAHATPVLVSDFGGMAELVSGESNGLRFTVGNVSDLARQLQRVLESPALLQRLTQGAAETHLPTLDDEMAQLLSLYYSVDGS